MKMPLKLALGVQAARFRNAGYAIHQIVDPVLADPNANDLSEHEWTS